MPTPPFTTELLSRAFLMTALLCVFCFSGCRFREEGSWMEAHGEAQMTRIAGGEDGIFGIGGGGLYRYPGPSVPPWVQLPLSTPIDVSACGNQVFVLDKSGLINRFRGNQSSRVPGSRRWKATRIAITCKGSLLVLVGKHAYRRQLRKLLPLPCQTEAIDIAASEEGVFLVTHKGTLVRGDSSDCIPVDVPGSILSVAVKGKSLAVVTSLGRVHFRSDKGWQALPPARSQRPGQASRPETFTQVALSGDSLIALGSLGSVFMTSPPL